MRPSDAPSVWEIDVASRRPLRRHAGISGRIYPIPETENDAEGHARDLLLISDTKTDRVHIFNKKNLTDETKVITLDVPGGPGKMSFFNTVDDASSAAHWLAFIALGSDEADSGVAVVDIGEVLAGNLTYSLINVGPGRMYRSIERGGPWVLTPVAEGGGSYTGVAVIDARTGDFRNLSNVTDAQSLLWMPHWTEHELTDKVGVIGNTPDDAGERRKLRGGLM
ncbi:unnamed protein product [Vitrella brassicaformis CCMP3155]|uniref:Uncharacterized protein n=1 Tax=Vitrella brassicaformis (strain CCMP3155) TaxID=1169540 RepID=A0A0G4FD67_VITBC|nr:unnamed protein product [Vitrella brassicaformis CCMP3155]|eukprot:CEM11186.1 unnamed protein product [Vitrella brassicaformis CCMP3155]